MGAGCTGSVHHTHEVLLGYPGIRNLLKKVPLMRGTVKILSQIIIQ